MPGAAAASVTVIGELAAPSAVITSCADGALPRFDGTCTLTCSAEEYRMFAGLPSNVTAIIAPFRLDPFMVAREPATRGPARKVAAFVTLATFGWGTAAAPTFKCTGISTLPACPPSIVITAS